MIFISGFLNLNWDEWDRILSSILLVLSFEAVNSGFEIDVDRTVKVFNSEVKISKNVFASGVFLVSVKAAITGIIILGPKILLLI